MCQAKNKILLKGRLQFIRKAVKNNKVISKPDSMSEGGRASQAGRE